jgi:hypothetical protein
MSKATISMTIEERKALTQDDAKIYSLAMAVQWLGKAGIKTIEHVTIAEQQHETKEDQLQG